MIPAAANALCTPRAEIAKMPMMMWVEIGPFGQHLVQVACHQIHEVQGCHVSILRLKGHAGKQWSATNPAATCGRSFFSVLWLQKPGRAQLETDIGVGMGPCNDPKGEPAAIGPCGAPR